MRQSASAQTHCADKPYVHDNPFAEDMSDLPYLLPKLFFCLVVCSHHGLNLRPVLVQFVIPRALGFDQVFAAESVAQDPPVSDSPPF